MAYVKTTVHAGLTYEIWEGHTREYHKGAKREKRAKPTPEQQEKVNRLQRERTVRRLINHNFAPGDLYITLSYREKPEAAQMAKDMRRFRDRLRRDYRKRGYELKYLYVMEVGKRGARHFHMVLNRCGDGPPAKWLQEAWGMGWINIKPLDSSGDYAKLASYLVKYADKTQKTLGLSNQKGYTPSRNLKRPRKETTRYKRRRLPDGPQIPRRLRGKVYLCKDSYHRGINPVTGYEYQEYRLIEYPRHMGAKAESVSWSNAETPQKKKKKACKKAAKPHTR